jgi:cell division protein FtsQ
MKNKKQTKSPKTNMVKRQVARTPVVTTKVTKKRGAQLRRGSAVQQKLQLQLNFAPYVRAVGLMTFAGLSIAALLLLVLSVGKVSVERVSFAGDIQQLPQGQLVNRVNPYIEDGYFSLDLDAIKASVEQEAWVLAANVQREWPWSLRVTIEEQTPIAYWGRNALLNHRGDVFVPANIPKDLSLPTLEGPNATAVGVLQAYQLMTQLLVDTPLQLSHVLLNEDGQWLGVTSEGVEIKLGRKQPVQNMKRFLQVYREKLQGRFADVQQVDTRYINGIAVDWREGRT